MSDTKKQKREDPPGAPPGSGLSEEEQAEAVAALQEVQEELDKLNEKASDEVLKVEQKWNKERKPIFEKRSKAISKLQDFWPAVLMSHAELFSAMTEQDHGVLEFLRDLQVQDFPDIRSGHTISMTFAENPYFEDTVLTKTYKFSDEGTVKITGTKIRWKPGKDITVRTVNGTSGKEGKKRELEEEQESFFKWFDIPDGVEIDAEGAEDEIADLIREDLWPNPLRLYNQEEDEEGGEDEQGEGDEEGVEGEEEGDEEEGEDE